MINYIIINIIIILLFIIINYFLKNIKEKYKEKYNNKLKICLYSYNFGNYRNELKNIDVIKKIDSIDYYFFTENINSLQSNKWKIINYPIIDKNTFLNKNRFTGKKCKFDIPDILKQYDYIIHIDSKKNAFNYFNKNITLDKIYNIINQNKNIDIFFRTHSEYPNNVKNIYQEIERVIKRNLESSYYGNSWKNKLLNEKWTQKDAFIDSDFFIRKYSPQLNNKLIKIIDYLEYYKLQRDQLVVPYIIQNPSNNIYYKILNKNFN